MLHQYLVIAIHIGPRAQHVVLVGPQGVVDDVQGHHGLDGYIAYELMLLVATVGTQIVDAPLGLWRQVHRDTDAVEQPLVRIVEHEMSQVEGMLHTHTAVRKSPSLALEGSWIGGVVQEDLELVLEAEDDAPQRIV